MKRWLCLLLCLVGLLCGCQSAPADQGANPNTNKSPDAKPLVGVCLPQSSGLWADRWTFWQTALEDLGYEAVLQDAQGDILLQCQQVSALLDKVELLVIAPLDSAILSPVLETANIPIIAYDSMLTDTNKVSFLATFDYFQMGKQMGQLVTEDLRSPKTLELFMSQAETEQSLRYYQGLMEELTPHLDSGMLTIPSGHVTFEDTAVAGGLPELAEQTLQRYLELYYAPSEEETETAPTADRTEPEIVISGSDDIAQGCLARLTAATVCGQGATKTENLTYTVFKDYASLDDACLLAVKALLAGKTPETNVDSGMFNNSIQIPTWLGTYQVISP